MCKYVVNANQCSISKEICPYMYFCTKENLWRENRNMPSHCKVQDKMEVPEGYYRVREERKGYLYVDIDNQTYKVLNPFKDIPQFVKATISKSGVVKLKK